MMDHEGDDDNSEFECESEGQETGNKGATCRCGESFQKGEETVKSQDSRNRCCGFKFHSMVCPGVFCVCVQKSQCIFLTEDNLEYLSSVIV